MKINPPFPVVSHLAPREGTRAARIDMAFPADNGGILDLSNLQSQGELFQCQTLFIDNSGNDSPLILQSSMMRQGIKIPAGAQAYLPILAPNPVQFIVTCASANASVYVFAMNYFVPPALWGITTQNVDVLNFPAVQPVSQSGAWSVALNNLPKFFGDANASANGNNALILASATGGSGFVNLCSVAVFLSGFTCAAPVQLLFGFGSNTILTLLIPPIAAAYTGQFFAHNRLMIPNPGAALVNANCFVAGGPITAGSVNMAMGAI